MTHNNKWSLPALVAVAALVFPVIGHASLTRAVSFDEKVSDAASIIVGKCTGTRSAWDSSHRFIVTYSTFAVEKSYKGDAAGEVTLVTPGGAVGDIHQDSIGIPEFKRGDEHVLFVKDTSVGKTVLYFDQGAYDVIHDARGEQFVQPVPSDAILVDTQRGMAVGAEAPRPLREFERQVQTSLKQQMNRMELMKGKEQGPSIWASIMANKGLIALALIGAALATWQLTRK